MKTCKKLFSLLLVAVMLVAALPFAAMAAPIGTAAKQVTVIGQENGQEVHRTTTDLIDSFDPDNTTHLSNAFLYGSPSYDLASEGYTVKSGVFDSGSNTLTVQLEKKAAPAHTHNYQWDGKIGDANGHTEVCSEANCTEPSKTVAHSFDANGKCTVCGYQKPTAASYTKVDVVIDGKSTTYVLSTPYTGSTNDNDAATILNAAGAGVNMNNYNVTSVTTSGDTITVTLATKPYAGYTLTLTVLKADGTTAATKTYMSDSFSGNSTDTLTVLKAFGVDKEYNLSDYTYPSTTTLNGKAFNITITAKPTSADVYTVTCITDGSTYANKTNVTYTGSFDSNVANAQAILNSAGINVTAANYQKCTITKNGSTITVDLRNTVSVKVYNSANSFTQVTMDIGQPYLNYLGTNLINNSSFGGITVKNTSGQSTFYSASAVTGGNAKVGAYDAEVTIQRDGEPCTIYFLRSDGTVLESRKVYAGEAIGTLPSYVVGNVPAVWTYNGKPVSATDVFNFKSTSVNFVPYFGGISDVYVDVYINGNVKTMQTRVKVTDMVQNGVLYMNNEVKSAIASALRNTSNNNLTYTGFFDASNWSDFIKTKNTSGATAPISVGDNTQRQGAVYLYVMVNNATVKATDSTNPKTGDNVRMGAAAAVLAVAVVGFGAVTVINKKKGAL